MTTRSSFAFGPDAYAAFFTRVSCVPFCQLWNLNGPLAMSIESLQSLLKSCPTTLWVGMGEDAARTSHAKYDLPFLKTIVTDLPFAFTLARSCHPSRDVMSQFGFMTVRYSVTKSPPVTGLPSLHFAVPLYLKVTVSGLLFTSLAGPSIRYGTSCAFW